MTVQMFTSEDQGLASFACLPQRLPPCTLRGKMRDRCLDLWGGIEEEETKQQYSEMEGLSIKFVKSLLFSALGYQNGIEVEFSIQTVFQQLKTDTMFLKSYNGPLYS